MSSANVLPSAPPREDERLYPPLPEENIEMSRQAQTKSNAQNFRLSKISEIEKQIADESEHYRVVLKKYKKARQVIHNIVVTLGAVTAVLSEGAIASSATGVGIFAAIPIASVAAVCGVASTCLTALNKKIERKVNKHTKIQSLALSKHDTIRNLVSTALENDKVTDAEFAQVAREMHKYHKIKEYLRAESDEKQTATADISTQTEPVDVEKIRNEIWEELRKKLANLTPELI